MSLLVRLGRPIHSRVVSAPVRTRSCGLAQSLAFSAYPTVNHLGLFHLQILHNSSSRQKRFEHQTSRSSSSPQPRKQLHKTLALKSPPPLQSSYTSQSQEQVNNTVLYSLISINVAVFVYFKYLEAQAAQGFPEPLQTFVRNMTFNVTDSLNGRWWTPATAMFTHFGTGHLAMNMVSVYFLGKFLTQAPQITPGRYLFIALGSGLAGMAGHSIIHYLRNPQPEFPDNRRSLGFSGCLMGISSVAACLAPFQKVYIWGVLPLPLWALVAGYALYDGYYLNNQNSRVGHAGHLGGLTFGLLYYFARLRGLRL